MPVKKWLCFVDVLLLISFVITSVSFDTLVQAASKVQITFWHPMSELPEKPCSEIIVKNFNVPSKTVVVKGQFVGGSGSGKVLQIN
ncbi:hypothetical protein ACAG39_09560 [Caldicellulosiruptoraceae bacterium PP1]